VATPQEPPARRPDTAVPPTPAADQPAARLPTAEAAPRPKPVATVERRVAQPGDRICANCGEPNDPARKFCRRCGNTLAEARVVADKPLPWWRRIFRRTPKQPKQYAAGERVGSMKQGAKPGGQSLLARLRSGRALLGVLMGAVVAVGIFGYVGIPSFTGMVNGVISGGIPGIINRIQGLVSPTLTIERPISVVASTEVADHPATKLFDTFTNTDWQGEGESPKVTVTFKDELDLGAVYLHIGNADAFVDTRRPAALLLTFSDGSTTTITLEDVHDPQQFDLGASGVDSVVIEVTSTNGPGGAPVSISEIEFFKKG
jgi:hypothetical protein